MDELEKELKNLSDELKKEYLKKIKSYTHLETNIAISIKSDDDKLEVVNLFEKELDKKSIVESLKLDEKKIEAMNRYPELSEFYSEIIMTLNSTENKIKCLNLLDDWFDKVDLLENIVIENDEQRLLIVKTINDDDIACKIILEMEEEENKVKALDFIKAETVKQKVILSLSEKLRLELFEKLESQVYQCSIIKSILDDNLKEQKIEKIDNEENNARLIMSLKQDKAKLKKLERIKESKNIALIEMSLEDREKLKEIFLDKYKDFSKMRLNKNITIGIEIETEGKKSQDLIYLKELLKRYENGIKRCWIAEKDNSLNEGVEVISTILTDNKEDIEDIYMICEMLKRTGQEVTKRCGGHIHIGANYLTSKEAYQNLFEIWGNTEKIIYLISNKKGTIPRKGIERYAESISYKLNTAIKKGSIDLRGEEGLNGFIEEIKEAQVIRNSGINLLNVNNFKNTIEFRVPNGTIDPEVWIQNIRLFGRLVEISQRLAKIEKQKTKSKEDIEIIKLKEKLKEEIPEQEKMEILIDMLFFEEERNDYRNRYISNSRLLRNVLKEENPFEYIKFEKVDFEKRHSISEFETIARSGRSSINYDIIKTRESSNLDIEK